MGEKGEEKEKFSFGHFWGQKVGKVTKLRIGGYAAGLPGWFNAIGDEPAESRSEATGNCSERSERNCAERAPRLRSEPTFPTFLPQKCQNENFSFSPPFSPIYPPFSPIFQNLPISNNPFIINNLSQKQPFANPSTAASSFQKGSLWPSVKPPFWGNISYVVTQLKLHWSWTQVTLKCKVSWVCSQKSLLFDPKIAQNCPYFTLS